MDLHERALRKDLGEIVERESKLLYKNTTCKFLCEKTHLKKVTEHLDKWQNVAERDIEYISSFSFISQLFFLIIFTFYTGNP